MMVVVEGSIFNCTIMKDVTCMSAAIAVKESEKELGKTAANHYGVD